MDSAHNTIRLPRIKISRYGNNRTASCAGQSLDRWRAFVVSISRRTVLAHTVSCVCCAGLNIMPAMARTLADVGGCALIGTDSQLIEKNKITSANNLSVNGHQVVARSTGRRELDVTFDQALKRISDALKVFP